MPAFYLPVIVMLLALVFRGVAFEFRFVANTSKKYWNFAFSAGSTLAAFCQGAILGGLVQGVRVENGVFAGGPFDWATPFALMCGLGVVTGYALLGATWLVMKTEGPVAERSRAQAQWLLLGVLGFMGIVSLWTPLAFPPIRERWFALPNILFLWPVPLITALTAFKAWRWLEQGRDVRPFFAAIVLFMLGYAGLAISVSPYLVPHSITIWDAAAAPASQIFMLLGTLPLLPIILIYTGFVYYLFRGKLKEGEGYH
jgi:cytochrome d ubiquinol oxidase subunit II